MTARRQLGAKILVADLVVSALLLLSGILCHFVGPPPPPSRMIEDPPNTFNFTAVERPIAVRWVVAAPLLMVAAVGSLLLVLPAHGKDGT